MGTGALSPGVKPARKAHYSFNLKPILRMCGLIPPHPVCLHLNRASIRLHGEVIC
jgi:hypothetical protein